MYQSVRVLPTCKFKASLHQLFLHIPKLEHTYVDTPTLINKFLNIVIALVHLSIIYYYRSLFPFFFFASFPFLSFS